MFFVYILKSTEPDRYYIGQSENLEARLIWHNSSRARWTKRFQPWELIYQKGFATRSEALKEERFLKSLKNIKSFLSNLK